MFTEVVVSLAISIAIFIIDPVMTTFVIIMMTIVALTISKLVKPILKKKGEEWHIHGSLTYKWLIQSITGIKEIKVGAKEEFFEENFNNGVIQKKILCKCHKNKGKIMNQIKKEKQK